MSKKTGALARVHAWTILSACALGAAAHQALRVHELYLAPSGASGWGRSAATLGGIAGVLVMGRLVPRALERLPWLLASVGAATTFASFAPLLSFGSGASAVPAAAASVACLSALTAAAIVEAYRGVGRATLALGFVEYAEHPLRLLSLVATLAVAAVLATRLGFLRSGLVITTVIVVVLVTYPDVYATLSGAVLPRRRALTATTLSMLVAVVPSIALAERLLPFRELSRYADELVLARDGSAHRFVVAAAPGGYELFVDGQLRVASLDERRRASALVGPALARSGSAARVLLLHGGSGTIERDILRDPRVTSLRVVSDDPELVTLSGHLDWLSSRTDGALRSPRVRLETAEAAPWLEGTQETFDVIIDDLPAPTGHEEGKHFTKWYFEQLAAHLAPGGVVAFPATSAFSAREAFASILATAESAQLAVTAHHAAVPTLGVASFLVGSRRSERATTGGDRAGGAALDRGMDLLPRPGGEVATLSDQHVVAAFAASRAADATSGSASTAPPSSAAPSASAKAAPAPSARRRRYSVAAIGDSLTDTRSHGGRYLADLAERCPESRFDSYGKGGEMVSQMRRRFAADVLIPAVGSKPKYDSVIVFGGVNDLYSDLTAGRTVKKITADLSAMYGAAREHGLRVIALTVTPWGGFRRYYSDARAATTRELNRWILAQPGAGTVPVAVDVYSLLSCGDPSLLCPTVAAPFRDGLHFGLKGHRLVADALHRAAFADCR